MGANNSTICEPFGHSRRSDRHDRAARPRSRPRRDHSHRPSKRDLAAPAAGRLASRPAGPTDRVPGHPHGGRRRAAGAGAVEHPCGMGQHRALRTPHLRRCRAHAHAPEAGDDRDCRRPDTFHGAGQSRRQQSADRSRALGSLPSRTGARYRQLRDHPGPHRRRRTRRRTELEGLRLDHDSWRGGTDRARHQLRRCVSTRCCGSIPGNRNAAIAQHPARQHWPAWPSSGLQDPPNRHRPPRRPVRGSIDIQSRATRSQHPSAATGRR